MVYIILELVRHKNIKFMKNIILLFFSVLTQISVAQTYNPTLQRDIVVEANLYGYVYDKQYRLSKINYRKTQENLRLPASMYVKLWEETKNGNGSVKLYWLGPQDTSFENGKLWKKLRKKYGERILSLRTESDSIISVSSIPAVWLYGDTLFLGENAMNYNGFYVVESRYSKLLVPEGKNFIEYSGNVLTPEKSNLMSDLDDILNFEYGFINIKTDVPVNRPIDMARELNLYARDITKCMGIKDSVKNEGKYEITLCIDKEGYPHLYKVDTVVKDIMDSILISSLHDAIEKNKYDTFKRMITVDGDVFPFRFITAIWRNKRWYFVDKLWSRQERDNFYKKYRNRGENTTLKTLIGVSKSYYRIIF